MRLRRIQAQADETLEQFYRDLVEEPTGAWAEVRDHMLQLIRYLEIHNIGTEMWTFTSLTNLHFTPVDNYRYAIAQISYSSQHGYIIEYSLPPTALPDASVPQMLSCATPQEAGNVLNSIFQQWRDSSKASNLI